MDQNIIHNINYPELAQEVKERKEKSPDVSHKEIVSTIIAEKKAQFQPAPQAPSPNASQPQAAAKSGVLPAYAQDKDPAIKNIIEHLITLTLQKGLDEGISYAQKEDPFILDTYHDALSDVLLDEMKKRKLL
jgi:hypothetical protein